MVRLGVAVDVVLFHHAEKGVEEEGLQEEQETVGPGVGDQHGVGGLASLLSEEGLEGLLVLETQSVRHVVHGLVEQVERRDQHEEQLGHSVGLGVTL